MAVAREHLAGAVAGGAFYALAGRAAGRGNFTTVERYVPRRRGWERLPDMRKARGGIAAATVQGRIVVFGGEEAGGTIGEVELYDPRVRRWTGLPDLRTPRHGLGGVSRGRRVYAIEGGPTPGFDFSSANEALDIE
jgi:non-specific serine/threonine protein kinase